MGNGFTFELETLIFFALSHSVCKRIVDEPFISVYGDDIIIPTGCSEAVIAFLRLCGFSINKEKSFTTGLFRESCGGDFFDGVPVRGHYVKTSVRTPAELISMANGIRRSADYRFPWIYRTWRRVLDRLPVEIRSCRGPEDLGDLVVHDDQCRWNLKRRNSIRYVRVWRPARHRKVAWGFFRPNVVLASALYGLSSGDTFPLGGKRVPFDRLGVNPRDSVLGHKLGWVPFS
jgi:hypothetical protein